jgi:hypothetical protein
MGGDRPVKRIFDNLLIDLIAAALMIGMLATGFLLRFPLPPGSNKYLTLWGLTRHQWGDVHFWISLGLLATLALHLCLHWKWLVISVRRRLVRSNAAPGSVLVSGLLTTLVLVAVLVVFGWAAQSGVKKITEPIEGVCPPSGTAEGDHALDAGGMIQQNPSVAGQKLDFWRDVYPILERSCLRCHGPNKQRGDFRVDRREDFFGKGGSSPLVVPGNSAESPLIAIVSGLRKDVPRADVHCLPAQKIALLRAWVDVGAPWPDRCEKE